MKVNLLLINQCLSSFILISGQEDKPPSVNYITTELYGKNCDSSGKFLYILKILTKVASIMSKKAHAGGYGLIHSNDQAKCRILKNGQ